MPSSTSSSDAGDVGLHRRGFVRLTAADRPGVAQPVPERDIPARPWRPIATSALVLALLLVAGWELAWRAYGVVPGYRNSNGAWAEQRRRLDDGEGDALVLIGSSRVLFDVQLPEWEKTAGRRPIQLALEGTSPLPILEDLAKDEKFTGSLLVGVDPDLFFSGAAYREAVLPYYHKQGPSQRSGHWLSQHLLEPNLAFLDPDFALATVVKRQPWPVRPGVPVRKAVRKLMVSGDARNAQMWSKVENDPDYRALVRSIWAQRFGSAGPMLDTPEKRAASVAKQIERAVDAVAALRARGVAVVFVRSPSSGPFHANEEKFFPRALTWEPLLARTGAPGIHFEDFPQLQGYDLPEWSHMSASEARRYTVAFAPLVEQRLRTPVVSATP